MELFARAVPTKESPEGQIRRRMAMRKKAAKIGQ